MTHLHQDDSEKQELDELARLIAMRAWRKFDIYIEGNKSYLNISNELAPDRRESMAAARRILDAGFTRQALSKAEANPNG